jgi:hypothetical protein
MTDENQTDDTGEDQTAEDQTTDTGEDKTDGGDAGGSDDNGTKNSDSLLDNLEDGEGVEFDFSTGEKPEDFPDDYWDAENKAPNAQKLYEGLKKQEKIAADLRAKMGKGDHKAPKTADEYKFEPSEKSAEFMKDDDPLVKAARETAHKYGMSQEMFSGFISEISDHMVDIAAEIAENPPEYSEDQLKEMRQAEYKKIGENAPAVIRAVETFGKEMMSKGLFSESDLEAFKSMAVTGDQVRVLNKLRSQMGGSDIPMDMTDDGLPADAEIADMIDKAYASKDAAKIRKAEEMLDKRRAAGRPERLQF